MKVVLTPSEVYHGAAVGMNRRVESMRLGLKSGPVGFNSRGRWEIDLEGALAEMAVAKGMDLYWAARVNTFKTLPDIDPYIEVRSGRPSGSMLIVRPNDHMDSAYVLAVGAAPVYNILGWLWGREAMKPEFEYDKNGRAPAYFVPKTKLRPIEDLIKEVANAKSA